MFSINKKFRVCIIGSGFGGISTLINLSNLLKNNSLVEIFLISNSDYFLFTPLLHEVATYEVSPENIVYPIEKLKESINNFTFLKRKVNTIDFDNRKVITDIDRINYDYLVLSLGSVTNFYGNKNLEKNSFTLKTLEDAVIIRENIKKIFIKKNELKIVVAGGGATGLELIGNIKFYIDKLKVLFKNNIPVKLILVEKFDKLLQEFKDDEFSNVSLNRLKDLGIEVLLETEVIDFYNNKITFKRNNRIEKEIIDIDMLIWTAGIKPNPLVLNLDLEKNSNGRIIVDDFLNPLNYPEVYVIGDIAYNPNSKENYTTAQMAIQQAENVANNIYSKTRLFKYSKPFKYNHKGNLVTIGKNFGISNIKGYKFKGFYGWLLWKIIHLIKLNDNKNKLNVLFDWLSNQIYL
ncbi:MAG: NADH dehydrogenase [Candidatus Sericytochromatia bacterium]|nr:MAG: NADH dehydrogenase [Candidatus Sericytochromatia bacterium]